LVLDDETLIVGCGERSSAVGVRILAERVLRDQLVSRFVEVNIPVERATMHLDTVFTIIGPEDCVYFPPLFDPGHPHYPPAPARTYELVNGEITVSHQSPRGGLFEELERIGKPLKNRIKCGGESPLFQTREQWTDGANLFAARPRVAFIYERNTETIRAFERNGYRVCATREFCQTDPATVDRTLVTLTGGELSRGRGGARCMTLPISRTR
ncbi:MAG TPA: arginine deiminase family protein, partial [candidate division Zixibacteria bacterium]|nr:arginine deiminase family protein [candidate division Zixibacteria bacterium]